MLEQAIKKLDILRLRGKNRSADKLLELIQEYSYLNILCMNGQSLTKKKEELKLQLGNFIKID